MNQVTELLTPQSVVGIINTYPHSETLHSNILSSQVGSHIIPRAVTLFEAPSDGVSQPKLTDVMEFFSERGETIPDITSRMWPIAEINDAHFQSVRRFNQLAYGVTHWMIKNNVNVLLSPGHLMKDVNMRLAGNVALRAAYRAAAETAQDVTVLNYHPNTGFQGNWLAPGVPKRNRFAIVRWFQSNILELPIEYDTTYTHIKINAPPVHEAFQSSSNSVKTTEDDRAQPMSWELLAATTF